MDSNSTDSELIEFTLHHLVRRSDKPCAKQLRINDEKFSFYREYEDRVRNRRCCCESSLEKFGKYNFERCKHARYFNHINKELTMHRLIREDEKYRNRLETFDRKLAILKFYLQRKFELNYDLIAFEMDLTNKHPTKRKELITDFVEFRFEF